MTCKSLLQSQGHHGGSAGPWPPCTAPVVAAPDLWLCLGSLQENCWQTNTFEEFCKIPVCRQSGYSKPQPGPSGGLQDVRAGCPSINWHGYLSGGWGGALCLIFFLFVQGKRLGNWLSTDSPTSESPPCPFTVNPLTELFLHGDMITRQTGAD